MTFVLREMNEAVAAWEEITGLSGSSPEWGEVLAVLDDCGLLDADRTPPRTLFDNEDSPPPPEHTAAVLRTTTAIVAGAYMAREQPKLPPATCVEIMMVLLDRFHPRLVDEWFTGYDEVLGVKAARRVQALADSPSAALGWLIEQEQLIKDLDVAPGTMSEWLSPVLALLLDLARQDDTVAERLFTQLSQRLPGDAYAYELAPLCDGQWVVFSTGPV